MEQEEMKLRLEEALKEETFVKALAEAETPEDAQKIFAGKGIDISLEEINAIAKQFPNDNGELNENELETVSGGTVLLGPLFGPVIISALVKIISKIKW